MFVGHPSNTMSLADFRESFRSWCYASCRYCGVSLSVRSISPDHRVPLSRGGTAEYENIDLICTACNRAKGSFSGEVFDVLLHHLNIVEGDYPESGMKAHVLRSLKIANSFRFGSDRARREKAKGGSLQ